MRFSRIFTSLVAVSVPVMAVARTPTEASSNSVFVRDNTTTTIPTSNDAITAQESLTSVLGDLLDLIKSIMNLLSPTFFDDVGITVTNLADLLAPPFTNETRSIIDTAGGLLTKLEPVLDKIGEIDIVGLIDKVITLLDKFGSIDLGSIIDSLLKLLTSDIIDKIVALINKLSNLLTDDLLANITLLVNDLAPLVDIIVQLITAIIGIIIGG